MKRFETALSRSEIFIIPTFGFIKKYSYIEEKEYIRIAFAWLNLRASIIIWEGKSDDTEE